MLMLLLRGLVAGLIVVGVSQIAGRYPRLGALLLTLPIVSIVAFVATWTKDHNLAAMSRLSRETIVLVMLGLPFFLPLAVAEKVGLSFWAAMLCGTVLACFLVGFWFWLGARTG